MKEINNYHYHTVTMKRSTHFIFAIVLCLELNSSQQCPDLYKHCDRWKSQVKRPESEPIWNRWQEAKTNVVDEIKSILLSSNSDWSPRVMYESCVNTSELERHGLKQMKLLLKVWTLLDSDYENTNDNFLWLNTLLLVHKLGASPLLNIHVSPDIFEPHQYALYIEPGSRFLPEGAEQHLRDYGQWIYSVAKVFNGHKRGLEEQVLDILRFEKELASLTTEQNNGYTSTTLSQITTIFPPPFDKYLLRLLHDINSLPSTKILIKSIKYLQALFELLKSTSAKTISNYLGWCLFLEVSRDSVQQFRHLSFLIDKAVLGVTEDVPRDVECVRTVMDRMGFSIVGKLGMPPHVLEYVKTIFVDVQNEFKLLLNGTKWLSERTKFEAIRKIDNVRCAVAFPKWAKNETEVDKYYSNLSIGSNHLSNMVSWKLWKRNKEFSLLGKPVENLEWPLSPFDVNAFYSVLQNVIIIPIAILQLPFFSSKRSMAQNYGALGSLIGHELSHSLDTSGRHFNPDGQLKTWWTPNEIRNYEKRIQCFVKQYQQLGVNGDETLGENIADSVGLALAYEALWRKTSNLTYQEEQEFFYSYAMQWCELSSEEVERLSDVHAPVSYRVLGATSNLPAFQRAYNCIQIRDYCTLW